MCIYIYTLYIYIYICIYLQKSKYEIKYVEKQKKLLHLFPPCRNKRVTYSPVCLFDTFFNFLFTFWK